jgi:plasmid maintenance system antidote protein VapI
MSRYITVDNLSDNTDNILNVGMQVDDTVLISSFDIPNNAKANINESLNKYDFYDSLLESMLIEREVRLDPKFIKNYLKKSSMNEKQYKKFIKQRYTMAIKNFIDENYITIDMAIKIAKAKLYNAIPEKFNKKDFFINLNDEKEVEKLKNKYRKQIKEDEIKYIEEEKRSLNFEKERIDKEYEQALLQTAALATKRNKINERIKSIG